MTATLAVSFAAVNDDGRAPAVAEVGSAGLPVLQLQVMGPGWRGLSYDRERRMVFVPAPLAPPAGDELVLQLETPDPFRPVLRARARVAAEAGAASGTAAGFSATLCGDSDAVHRVLSATCPGAAQGAPVSAPASVAGRRRRVLVVDDDALARRMLSDAFKAEGFDVITAPDAEFAMHTLADQLLTLDLLVTDVVMPGKDGELLVRSIRRIGGEADLPILVMSGRVDAAVRERLRLAGADGVVAKSIGAESIVRMAEGVLARRQAEALETVG